MSAKSDAIDVRLQSAIAALAEHPAAERPPLALSDEERALLLAALLELPIKGRFAPTVTRLIERLEGKP